MGASVRWYKNWAIRAVESRGILRIESARASESLVCFGRRSNESLCPGDSRPPSLNPPESFPKRSFANGIDLLTNESITDPFCERGSNDFEGRNTIVLLAKISRMPDLNPVESGNAAVLGKRVVVISNESFPEMFRGRELNDLGRRIVVSLLTEVSRTPTLAPLESVDTAALGKRTVLVPIESLANTACGSESKGRDNEEPEKNKNAIRATTTMPSKTRLFLKKETILTNMDVRIGFTTGIEKTVNCPKA